MTTFANMAPEQRAECVGMWCYVYSSPRKYTALEQPIGEGIVAGFTEPNASGNVIICRPHPNATTWTQPLNKVEPRTRLPRAWNPDGSPAEKWDLVRLVHGEDRYYPWAIHRGVVLLKKFKRENDAWAYFKKIVEEKERASDPNLCWIK